jgi:small subunit ribosomal protein S6
LAFNRKEKKTVNFYETVFIVRQDASPSHVESVANDVIAIIKNGSGEVTKTEFCGLRTLAYPINNSRKGHYVLLNVACAPEIATELERKLRLNEDVIRFLIVRVDKLDNNPSALMRKSFRDNASQEQEQQR